MNDKHRELHCTSPVTQKGNNRLGLCRLCYVTGEGAVGVNSTTPLLSPWRFQLPVSTPWTMTAALGETGSAGQHNTSAASVTLFYL